MIIQTLYGFVVTDVIFGVVSIVVLGQCEITAHQSGAFAKFHNPLKRSTIAAKSPAPAEGAGKRGGIADRHNAKHLALDRSGIFKTAVSRMLIL